MLAFFSCIHLKSGVSICRYYDSVVSCIQTHFSTPFYNDLSGFYLG